MDAREGAAGKGASSRRMEGNNNTIRRAVMMMMMMINGAPNSHSTPVEPLQTLLLKERLLEGCRKGGWVLFGGLAMVFDR